MRRLAPALLVAAVLAGCGDDDATDRVAAPAPSTAAPSPTTAASAPPSPSRTPEPVLSAASRIGVEGAGELVAGTTVREAEELTGLTFAVDGFEDFDGTCYWATPVGLEEHLTFMVLADTAPADPKDGTLARASADQSMGDAAATVSGIRVGDTAERVREVYGDRVTASPHTYQERGEYLDVVPQDPALSGFLLRMEVGDSGLVEQVHGGLAEAVQAVEGCA